MSTIRFRIDSASARVIVVSGSDELELPALWLRERCQDPAQVDARTRQRLFNPHELPEDLDLTAVEADARGGAWLTFSDGYRGRYDFDTLAVDFDPHDGVPATLPWRSSLELDEVRFDWDGIGEPRKMHAALGALLARGFIVLCGVPTEREQILAVARAFGYLRDTNFGRYFEVFSRPGANDLAYSAVPLGPHTDNPYREPVPGIQILHCLINETTGGLSTLVDSLAVGEALALEDREAYERLAGIPVRFRFVDKDEEFIERRTIIRHNAKGEMTGVHYSPRLDDLPLLEPGELAAFQRARRHFGELLVDPRFEIRFPLRAGELMMFDNSRILHGRTGFDPQEGRRHLQGCYIDIDEPCSRYRILSRQLQAAATREET